MEGNDKMKEVAKDIIEINIEDSDTVKDLLDKFYDVMRKHGIKKGTQSVNDEGEEVGVLMNNYEWTMAWELFLVRVHDFFNFKTMLEVPKDVFV